PIIFAKSHSLSFERARSLHWGTGPFDAGDYAFDGHKESPGKGGNGGTPGAAQASATAPLCSHCHPPTIDARNHRLAFPKQVSATQQPREPVKIVCLPHPALAVHLSSLPSVALAAKLSFHSDAPVRNHGRPVSRAQRGPT